MLNTCTLAYTAACRGDLRDGHALIIQVFMLLLRKTGLANQPACQPIVDLPASVNQPASQTAVIQSTSTSQPVKPFLGACHHWCEYLQLCFPGCAGDGRCGVGFRGSRIEVRAGDGRCGGNAEVAVGHAWRCPDCWRGIPADVTAGPSSWS